MVLLDEKPDLVLAFPGNKGTRDMLRRAEDAKKKGMPIEIKKVVGRTSLSRRDSATFAWNHPVKLARVGPRLVRFTSPVGWPVSPIASRAPWRPATAAWVRS